MGVAYQLIAGRIGQGGLAETVVPLRGPKMTRHDAGARGVVVLHYLGQIPALRSGEGSQPQFVEQPRGASVQGVAWRRRERRTEKIKKKLACELVL